MEQKPLVETNPSKEEFNFDDLPLEAKVGTLAEELEAELKTFEELVPRLSKKQLERVLRRTLNYPMKIHKVTGEPVEKVLSNISTKIEHLKILVIKLADELDKQQKEATNGNTEQV